VRIQKTFIFKIFVTSILFTYLCEGNLHGQILNNNSSAFSTSQNQVVDTSKNKQSKTDDRIVIYSFTLADTARQVLDSSISFLNRNPILNNWQIDLGNFGTAQKSLLFSPSMKANIAFGIESIQPYLFTQDNQKFYNTTRPYSNIYYRMGSKLEQMIDILHTQNIQPNWNFALNYRKIGSPGNYVNQGVNHDNASFTTNYLSNNNRYSFNASFLYNKLQQDENGGIQSDTFLTNPIYANNKLIPVAVDALSLNRSTVSNYYRNVSLNFTQNYFLGKYDTIGNDSLGKNILFKPMFGIQHQFYSNFNYARFKDLTPDSTFYFPLELPTFAKRDSVFANQFLNTLGNAFSFIGNIRFKKKILQTEAGYGIELETPHNAYFDKTYLNNFLFAKINKPSLQKNEWQYDAAVKFYFSGERAIGNFNLTTHAGKMISPTIGKIDIGFEQSLQSAPYLMADFGTNYLQLKTSFSKQTISKFYLSHSNLKYKTNLHFNYYVIGNYIYRDTSLMAKQDANVIPVLQGLLSKRFVWNKLVFDNDFLLQYASNNSPIQLPNFASRHRVAYESKLLKNKLQTAVGFDFRYHSPFFADHYSPLYFSFVTNYTNKISNYPQAAFFFNFKVKRFRASFAIDELQNFVLKNNMNYHLYPAQNYTFRFGFHWAFIN
jgi:hypothetical protein